MILSLYASQSLRLSKQDTDSLHKDIEHLDQSFDLKLKALQNGVDQLFDDAIYWISRHWYFPDEVPSLSFYKFNLDEIKKL